MLRNVWNQVRTAFVRDTRPAVTAEPSVLTLSYDKVSWGQYKTLKERGLPELEEMPSSSAAG